MKTLFSRACIAAILVLFVFSCDDSALPPPCRISKFYWEDEWHAAHYNSAGRLTALIADSSQVYLYYDDLMRLKSAEIFTGDPTPQYKFEFIHGPNGIIQADEYHPSTLGTEHNRILYHYISPSRVDYLIRQEWGNTETLGFEIQYDITYAGNNVDYIEGTSSVIHTEYFGGKYDQRRNPFRALAAAVGNPVFFPVCIHANFPVPNYDISLMSLFSRNNPLDASYQIDFFGVDPQDQEFTYTYFGNIAKTILWDDEAASSEDYAFEFECGRGPSEE
jgi:hypothetical protein